MWIKEETYQLYIDQIMFSQYTYKYKYEEKGK